MDAIFSRVSIREFTDEPVKEKVIEDLLKAGMAAPSAGNQQPWEFYVVTEPDTLRRLGETTRFAEPAAKAPLCIVPCARTMGLQFNDMVAQDMSACIENILLEAVDQGLGAVWLGVAPKEGRMNLVRNALRAPAHLNPFAIIAIGHPAEEKKQEDRFDVTRIHYVKAQGAPQAEEGVVPGNIFSHQNL